MGWLGWVLIDDMDPWTTLSHTRLWCIAVLSEHCAVTTRCMYTGY